MSARRRPALLLMVLLMGLAAAWVIAARTRDGQADGGTAQRPTLLLLTSLPLVFGEEFAVDGGGSPALAALRKKYDVASISVTSAEELERGRLLLMAHPPAQTAENLVELDDWVRNGGRLLLLADPLVEWPSARPLGDPLRPAPMFMDTGLLAHWGLQLEGPDRRGPAPRTIGERRVLTDSPGMMSGRCSISSDRLIARCAIGAGRVTVVADADFLNVADLGEAAAGNLDGLLQELALLQRS